jgi:hypothetical protein
MLGSLKTYARHLGLDEAALTREFKHRQALLRERQNQAQEESQPSEPRGVLASLSRLLGVGSLEREDDAGTVPDPGHSPRLYLSLGVVLIFVFVIALASTLRAEDQPVVSQVHETRVSKFPSMIALVGDLDDERNTGAENKENQPGKQAKSPAKDASKDEKDKAERGGQDKPQTAQASSSTASASASASPASTASAKARPASASPKPAATEEPVHEGVAAAAPAGPSARTPGGPGLQRKQAGPGDATRLRNRIASRTWSVVDGAW